MSVKDPSLLFKQLGSLTPETQGKIISSIVIILLLAVFSSIVKRIAFRLIKDAHSLHQWRKTAGYTTFFLGVLLVGRIWFEGFHSLATFLGLVSAGVAIALRDLMVNLAGWFFIIWRRPFEVGDRIQIGENSGDVIDLRIFQFTLMEIGNWVDADQSTGRVLHLPNGKVFTETIASYSKGFQYIWNEIPVLITFESNWRKAKEILQQIIEKDADKISKSAEKKIGKASKKFMISYTKLTPIVYTSVKESGVLLTIRYLCQPRRRRGSAEAIWEDILEEFARHQDLDFAYPTQRFYSNLLEGKIKAPRQRAE